MFAIHASYRGRSKRRAEYVTNVANALAASAAVAAVEIKGVEDFVCLTQGAEQAGGLVLSLLQAGDFAIGIGTSVAGTQLAIHNDEDESAAEAMEAATRAVKDTHKAGSVAVRIEKAGPGGVLAPGKAAEITEDIHAAFTLLAHVLARRTKEGREATALMRAGYLQSEAAAEVGISKQAMSQRLGAAGWYAEQAGWGLAIRMLARVDELRLD